MWYVRIKDINAIVSSCQKSVFQLVGFNSLMDHEINLESLE